MTKPNLGLRETLRICDACRRATAIDCDACHWCALDREEAANEVKATKSQPAKQAVPSLPAIVAESAFAAILDNGRPSPACFRVLINEARAAARSNPSRSRLRELASAAEVIAGILNTALDEQIQLGL